MKKKELESQEDIRHQSLENYKCKGKIIHEIPQLKNYLNGQK